MASNRINLAGISRRSPFIAICVILFLCLLSRAQTTTQSSEANFEVHEWSIYVLDASQGQINPDGSITSTLPEFIDTRRQSSPAESRNLPQPLSVIRITGQSDSRIDVMIEKSGGDFLASWPRAQSRQKQILWRDLKLSASPGSDKPADVDPGSWLALLRAADSDYLKLDTSAPERFLLYDFSLPCPSPISVTNDGNFSYGITNNSKSTLRDLTFYMGDNGTWRTALLGDVVPAKPPTTKPTTAPAAASKASTKPTTQPAQFEAKLSRVSATQPSDLAAEWKPKLLDRGILPTDADLITGILTRFAFDSRRLTAICFVDDTTCDRLFPIEVVPEPKKITRLGIVIIKYADPAAGTEIDDLIAQLGDPVWTRRDQAYKALQKLGTAAQPKLRDAAARSKDVEIVWRCEHLLETPTPSP